MLILIAVAALIGILITFALCYYVVLAVLAGEIHPYE